LIVYVVLAIIFVFIFNYFEDKENLISWPFLLVSILSLITCGLYFLFDRKDKITPLLYLFLVIMIDSFSFVLAYYSMNVSSLNRNQDHKYVYFFVISTAIFAILKFNFSFLHILIYFAYKSIIFGILINVFNLDTNDKKVDFNFEIICFSLTCFSIFLFTLIKQDFITKSIEVYVKNKFAMEYFQSLINYINKGFLSLNLTNYTINVNRSFINFIKSIGISDEIIQEKMYNSSDKKSEKPNLLYLRSFRRSRISTRIYPNNTSADRFYQKKSVSKRKNSTIIKNMNRTVKNIGDLIVKDNSELKNFNNSNLKNSNLLNKNEEKYKSEKNYNNAEKYDFSIIPFCNNEESFLLKIDFLLNHVFCHFYEENSYKRNIRKTKNSNYDKFSLSEAIREILYSEEKNDNLDQSFIFKGIYEYNKNKIFKNNIQTNIVIEVHYRKVKTINGELLEFFFNDVTLTRNFQKERVENKLKSMILAKVSNEFKMPLITIIYILKNYIQKTHLLKNGLSLEEVQIFDEDYISNTIDLSDYMLSIVNDIFDYSVINSNYQLKCEFDNFDFHELLYFSHRILKILINCRGLKDIVHPLLEINENVPRTFCSDEKRVKQILLNLITNSIKFTRRGYIKISAIMSNEENLFISIEDTGIGIQTKDISRIFTENEELKGCEKAYENDAVNSKGSGLGLSICKRIIKQIGKCIEVESIPNKKTKFYFILESNEKIMKKSFTVTKTLEGNLDQFKKNFMKVTTNSVKQAKIDNHYPTRRPRNNKTQELVNRIHNKNSNKNNKNNYNGYINKNNYNNNNKNNTSEKNNHINADRIRNKSIEKEASKLSKNNNSSLDNIGVAGENNNINLNINDVDYVLDMAESYISSGDNTIRISESKQKMDFDCNVNSDWSDSQCCSININDLLLLQKKINYNMTGSMLKNGKDKSFFKLIKPIKKFYDMKAKDIILVVDDNKFLRKSLKNNIRSIFANTCVDVIGCSDGIEILYLVMLDHMTKNSIKLIISDENMVYMNGSELNMILSSFYMEDKMSFIPFALCSDARIEDEFMIRNRINFIIKNPPTKNELKSVFITLNLI